MKTVIQRVQYANVAVNGERLAQIGPGLLILVGFSDADDHSVVDQMAAKIIRLRIFDDPQGKMNLDLSAVGGAILSISQFTLYADCRHGNRPGFTKAGKWEHAEALYAYFNETLRRLGANVETGIFGAEMKVELLNDGPITILLDSEELK